MAAAYHFEVITPQGIPYQAEIAHARIPAEDGYVGVLANHASYVTGSAGGFLDITKPDGHKKRFQTGPGFFMIERNKAVLLTESFAETP